jgi:hypothetical protein
MDFIPGYSEGIILTITAHPFYYVKLHLQTNKYNSTKDFLKQNSYKQLYRGIAISLTVVPVDRAIQFKCCESLNAHVSPFLSGGICGLISTSFMLPHDYVCNNYILNKNNTSQLTFIKRKFKDKKYTKIFMGWKPEILRSMMFRSIYLGTYGTMRNKYGSDLSQLVINSSVSGILSWTITYPVDTIKVEQQITTKGTTQIIKQRIKTYGILNFWKGIGPVYLKTVATSICGMTVYETSKTYFNKIT